MKPCLPVLAALLVSALAAPLDASAHDGAPHAAPPARPPDAPPGLAHHDHTPLHGGVVLMSGDDHVELLAEPGGVYRLWYTDAWRRPLKDGVKATLVVKTPSGEERVPLAPTGAPDGELRGRGAARDGEARAVHLDGFARGYPVKTRFDLRPVVEAKPGVPLQIVVTEAGFVPSDVKVAAGRPTTLRITRTTEATCAKDVVVPGLVERTPLPLGVPVDVTFTPRKSGPLRWGCSMNAMVGGVLFVP